jgi:membrane-bound lytic murein transglycosylase B
MKLLVGVLLTVSLTLVGHNIYAQESSQIDKFAALMASKHQIDAGFVKTTLAKANKSATILEAIARPWEAKPWFEYYPIFLTEKRLAKGLNFWEKNEASLLRAENELGIPAEIIVAIIGVETFYGEYKGKYKVLDALYTLGFFYPPRAKFFSSELEQLFLLSQEENFDIQQLMGSYAGAMGLGQFISSSYRHYAIDFDGDGVRDLLNNPVDAIGSVANYFKKHGWHKGQAVALKAEVSGKEYKGLLTDKLEYKHTWQDIQQAGVSIDDNANIPTDSPAKLFEFEQQDHKEYWLGLDNFYVITRYNHSPLYAMAVYQFSQQLKQRKLELL